jgi:hypothetical protein
MSGKYSGYNQSIARILRGFDKFVEDELRVLPMAGVSPEELSGCKAGFDASPMALHHLADEAQRYSDECKEGGKNSQGN